MHSIKTDIEEDKKKDDHGRQQDMQRACCTDEVSVSWPDRL